MSNKISYPFPLRPNLVVQLYLPLDLTKEEAERIAVYIKTLALEHDQT